MRGGPKSTHRLESQSDYATARSGLCERALSTDHGGVRQVGHKPYQIVAPSGRTVRECFPDLIPKRPYCANDVSQGLIIRGRDKAVGYRHIQYNGPTDLTWLLFDVDRADARFAAEDANLPQPTVIIVNRRKGHAHLAYLLGQPVLRFAESRSAPLRFAAAVQRGFVRRLGADPHYCGLIAKNPMHSSWCVEWLAPEPYDLPTLADWLFEPDTRPDPQLKSQFGLGRNCEVFDELRSIAYREVLTFKKQGESFAAYVKRLHDLAFAINRQFAVPLSVSEVRSIARSVAKWTWREVSLERFSEVQSRRGRRTRATTKARMAIVDALADDGA